MGLLEKKKKMLFGNKQFSVKVDPLFRRGLVCRKADRKSPLISLVKMAENIPSVSNHLKIHLTAYQTINKVTCMQNDKFSECILVQ